MVNGLGCVRSDGSCPIFNAFIIPWCYLELFRHIFCVGKVQVLSAGSKTLILEFPGNSGFEVFQTVENIIAEFGNDRSCNLTNSIFYGCFLLELGNLCRHNGCHVVLPRAS